jgi:hypothetical protein
MATLQRLKKPGEDVVGIDPHQCYVLRKNVNRMKRVVRLAVSVVLYPNLPPLARTESKQHHYFWVV